MRHIPYALVSAIYIVQPHHTVWGLAANVTLLLWSATRLATRSEHRIWTVFDVLIAGGYLAAASTMLLDSTAVPVANPVAAVASQTVISLALELSPWLSGPVALLAISVSAWGYGQIPHVNHPYAIFNVDFPALQWLLAVAVRSMIHKSAQLTDEAVAEHNAETVSHRAADRSRFLTREQWRLLHDTAAATLHEVGGNGGALDPDLLAEQAGRDLGTLEQMPTVEDTVPVDLVARLRQVSEEQLLPAGLSVEFRSAETAPVRAVHAARLAAVTRETLNNVRKHAQAKHVTIEVGQGLLTVADDGVGFDPDTVPLDRYGIRHSIRKRMQEIGGAVEIQSAPGEGTTVRVTWPAQDEAVPSHTAIIDSMARVDRTLSRLGYEIAIIAITVTSVSFVQLWFTHAAHIVVQAVLMALNIAFALTAVALVAHRDIQPPRSIKLAVAALAPIEAIALPHSQLLGNANWALGQTGWTMAAVTYRHSSRNSLSWVTVCWAVAGIFVISLGPSPDNVSKLGYLVGSVAVMQCLAVIFGSLLRDALAEVKTLNEVQVKTRAEQHIADRVQTSYRQNLKQLTRSAKPLLEGLATCELSPHDPTVQHRALTEYHRMRNQFAQADTYGHALTQQLRPAIDAAMGRGVPVALQIMPDVPDLNSGVSARLLAAPLALLDATQSRARISISSRGNTLTIAVTCDCDPSVQNTIRPRLGPPHTLVTEDRDTLLRIHHPLN